MSDAAPPPQAPVHAPGETVFYSGVYRVDHQPAHMEPHEVTCVKGAPFPACRDCGAGVRFTLLRRAHFVGNVEVFRDAPPRAG